MDGIRQVRGGKRDVGAKMPEVLRTIETGFVFSNPDDVIAPVGNVGERMSEGKGDLEMLSS